MSGGSGARLAVLVDGEPLAEADARAFWERFSAHMEANKGDLQGFASAEGLASVHPEVRGGSPVLVASRAGTQVPYGPAKTRGGSERTQAPSPGGKPKGSAGQGGPKKPRRR